MNARDTAVGARTLKRLRTSRGWSLAGLSRSLVDIASRLGIPLTASPLNVQRSLARWESDASPVRPSHRYQLLLGHVYARHTSGVVQLGPGSDFAELLTALTHYGESDRHLAELRALVTRTVTVDDGGLLALVGPLTRATITAALEDPARTEVSLINDLQAVVDDANRLVGSLPFVRLQLLLSPVVETCRRLLAGDPPPPALRSLHAVAAQAFTLAGRIAFETYDDATSRALYAAATEAAGHLPAWRRAVVHMSHALVTLYSTPGTDTARALVEAAIRDAQSGDSPAVRGRAHALHSEIAASRGDRRQALTALSLARYDVGRGTQDDPSGSHFSSGHLRGFEGLCALHTGDATTADTHFADAAAALTSPRDRLQRAIITTDQALARIHTGDPVAGTALLHACADEVSATGGRVPALRLRRARHALRPWHGEPFVTELDDHLLTVR
ncbi:hypothetical protein ACH4FX_08230 [Streptomyces sp. NPDC018019]|uniref:hypothetical protein n=1 Tax=Streptomyces sp. NPDC018019 TaxID=3365030 RepID=UPI0037950607